MNIDEFITEQEQLLESLSFEHQLLKKRYEALKIEVSYDIEQQAFSMLSPEEQNIVRQARNEKLAQNTNSTISSHARVMRSRRGLRV